MSKVCYICGKGTVVGRSQQHRRGVAGKRWKNRVTPTHRLFKPNLQKATILIGAKETQVVICTKCLKRRKKDAQTLALQV